MAKEPIQTVILRYFDKAASLKWFAVGLALGVPAWIWGTSLIPAWALKIASGFGWLLVVLLLALVLLSVIALLVKHRIGRLAHGDFQNVLLWSHPKLLRAASVLFGVVVIAAICWVVTGSGNALGTALYGSLLGGTLLWCWGGLAVIADELSKRSSRATT